MGGVFGSKTIHNKADKIAAFQVNSASYGETVPVIFGTTRISGNIIDYYDFTAIPHTETQRAGKGGGTKVKNTTYTYTVTCLLGLSEGPIAGIGRVWWDKEIYASPAAAGLTLFRGELGQQPWSYTQSKHPERALPYSGLAYVAGTLDLGGSGGLPNLNFENRGLLLDSGDGIDANPADVINYIVFDSVNGVGFGTGGIDESGLQRFRAFCTAADLLISSPPESDTRKAYEIINDICKAMNTINFWSQNRLKLVPLCDERLEHNGVIFEPNLTPEYDLDEDDFLEMEDGRLVVMERSDSTEAYNQATVEFVNRTNNYEIETVDYPILTDINNRGLRPADTESIHWLHTKERAHYVAGVKAMKSLYGRNKYRFRLDWSFSLLEPGDLLTLTESTLGLVKKPVIIDTAKEIDGETWEYVAVPRPPGAYSPGRYIVGEADRPSVDYRIDPGDINQPVIFSAPAGMTENGLETWCAVSGGPSWGGCNVWISDNNETYKMIGTIQGPARHGVLSAELPAGVASPDTANILQVQLVGAGQLLSGSQQDAQNMNTACWVDGEILAYAVATLTGDKQYDLSYLVRGAYDTVSQSHPAGAKFVRLDNGIFRYQFSKEDIGKTIYLKFTSFNIYGVAEQGLDDVEPVTHTLSAHYVPQVTNLQAYQHYREVGDGTITYEIDLSFTPPDSTIYDYADVYVKSSRLTWKDLKTPWNQIEAPWNSSGDGYSSWRYVGKANEKITYQNAIIGSTYTFKVVAVDRFGFPADDGSAPIVSRTIEVKPYTPTTPQGFAIEFKDKPYCSWLPNTEMDIDFYELRTDGNKGEQLGLLYRGNAITATPALVSRTGTLYLFAHNPSKHYSPPLIYQYNKPALPAPPLTIKEVFQGLIISCGALPASATGINVHVDEMAYFSPNNSYTFKADAGVFTIRAAYVDLFGEGDLSGEQMATIEPTVNPEWIAAESLSLEKMDGAIKEAVEKAQSAVSGVEFDDTVNYLNQANQGLANSITQVAGQTTSIITELGKPLEECQYTAIAQTLNNLQFRAADGTMKSLLNITPEAISIISQFLHITGQVQIDDNVILNAMLAAYCISAEKIQVGAVKAAHMDVASLSAISATIGTLRTATTGARTEICDNLITVYDANNTLRVRMGVW